MGISKYLVPLQFPALLALGMLQLLDHSAAVAKPAVEFDMRRSVECHDVTPPGFAIQRPNQRLVECALTLSVYLVAGTIDEVEAIHIEITDLDNNMTVRNFLPATRLESAYAGDIQATRTHESSRAVTASLGGEIPNAFGGVVAKLTPTINGTGSGKEVITETSKRVAPMQAVIASGTMRDEHGVFFILRSSPLHSLEGLHEFQIQFVVPGDWRGDTIHMVCRATGDQKRLWINRQQVWAEKSSNVNLSLTGGTGRY
jgi:hypothetical protein